MAVTGVTYKPQIVKLGGAVEERYAYAAGAVDTIAAGDLIRINTSGTIDLADAASAGAVHGIALEAGVAGSALPIIKFASDTIVKIQCIDTVAPEDLKKGVAYTLEIGTSVFGVTSTTTNGVALVVDYADTDMPWEDAYASFDEDSADNNNAVLVRFSAATLDGHAAAAS